MERIGPYEVLGRIGTGGSADLLLADDARADRPRDRRIVIKRLHPHLAADESYVRMFVAEARVMAMLQHDNVVRAYDFGADDERGDVWFTMELVDGPNLAAVHRLLRAREPLRTGGKREQVCPIPVALTIAMRIALGLDVVHHARDPSTQEPLDLVHRDVAPSNILVSRDGDVKLTDFGVVKLPKRGPDYDGVLSSESTTGGVLKGHLATMSPEAIRGAHVDARADVYSLGVVLWETITGLRMWEGTPLELVERIVNEPPPSLDVGDPDLRALLAGMLAKDPADRPESAAAVVALLKPLGPATSGDVANLIRSLKVPSIAR